MTDSLLTATSTALRLAKARRAEEVTPDDLLLGALLANSSLGIASIGPLVFDLNPLLSGRDFPDGGEAVANGADPRPPKYSPAASAVFDRAAAIVRADGEARLRAVHLLAVFGTETAGVMADLRKQRPFADAEWRAALSEWDRTRVSNGRGANEPGSVLSVEAAAETLAVHSQTIRGYIRGGKLPAYRIAGERAIRIFASDLYGLLERLEPNQGEEDAN